MTRALDALRYTGLVLFRAAVLAVFLAVTLLIGTLLIAWPSLELDEEPEDFIPAGSSTPPPPGENAPLAGDFSLPCETHTVADAAGEGRE